ncbi:F0F1 ATP synthase subunit epsilon [Brevibacillus fluminis]|uniref:ATP synthase epsilon chain n=1 Tax=Brevibacillus fluminis TaxID=511487 RepID=A0A3M8D2E8_9BACL|nr:F0F1 ATP synthase subunit epsilon [Brevibacillus fluminis]RNB82048.1 F0F1 ATP synthase subunit epsilon [Brevibacillus fluminis]
MSKLTIEVVTPERVVYSGEATMVIARGVEGDVGIMPNHMPLVTPLKIAPVRIKTVGDKETVIAVSGGFMEVRGTQVAILAESAELPEDIDVERAKQSKGRAEQRLNEKHPDLDIRRAERALQRAISRLEATKNI